MISIYMSAETAVYSLLLAAVFGACAGSFLYCVSWRILHAEPVTKGRSHCDSCGHKLGFSDLIPVASYFRSGGKCRYCGARLSVIHPVAEIIAAVFFVSILARYDLSFQSVEYLWLGCILMAASFADLEGRIIPDRFILAGIAGRIVCFFFEYENIWTVADALIGGAAVAGVLLVVVLIMENVLKKEAMGGGDIKLFFVTGLYLGWKGNFLCLILACLLGIVFGVIALASKKEDAPGFPFGPSIAMAAWIVMLFGNGIIGWYTGLFL